MGPAPDVSLTSPSPQALNSTSSSSQQQPLPAASRGAVLSSALGTGFWMVLLALAIRNFAGLANVSAVLGTDPEVVKQLLGWPPALFGGPADAALALGAAGAVTGARVGLMAAWPQLREATDRSNTQVLAPLGPAEVLLVALASGVPEELLFRGALIPATFPDWRGALLSAAIFGLLHNSGGRNPAFAAWAGAVGGLYGAVYLLSGNVWVPAAAHVAANAASALIWKARSGEAAAASSVHDS